MHLARIRKEFFFDRVTKNWKGVLQRNLELLLWIISTQSAPKFVAALCSIFCFKSLGSEKLSCCNIFRKMWSWCFPPHVVTSGMFCNTRSYAALRAADLDWIVEPGYSLGRVHSGERPWKTNLEPWKTMETKLKTMKNHENTLKTMETNQKPWKPWNYLKNPWKPWKYH